MKMLFFKFLPFGLNPKGSLKKNAFTKCIFVKLCEPEYIKPKVLSCSGFGNYKRAVYGFFLAHSLDVLGGRKNSVGSSGFCLEY